MSDYRGSTVPEHFECFGPRNFTYKLELRRCCKMIKFDVIISLKPDKKGSMTKEWPWLLQDISEPQNSFWAGEQTPTTLERNSAMS